MHCILFFISVLLPFKTNFHLMAILYIDQHWCPLQVCISHVILITVHNLAVNIAELLLPRVGHWGTRFNVLKQYSKLQATHGQSCLLNVDEDVHFDFGGIWGGVKGEFVLFQQYLFPMNRFCITPSPHP